MSFRKHLLLLKSYFRLSIKRLTEYKFNIITNTLSYVVLIVMWTFFWDLLFGNIRTMGEWNYPMMLLLVGFIYFTDALWQICWYTIGFQEEIIKGNLDLYLVRPISSVYAMVMKEAQVFPLLAVASSFALIIYTIFSYFSFKLLNFALALGISVIGVLFIHLIYFFISVLAFWLGKQTALRTILRSFLIIKNYPIDILAPTIRSFFIFFIPIYFLGTGQVIAYMNLEKAITIFSTGLVLCGIWLFVCIILWKRGLRRYESHGG